MRKFAQQLFIAVALLLHLPILAQDVSLEHQTFKTSRTASAPQIDGLLGDDTWKNDPSAFEGKFVQTSPDNGKASAFPTKVQIRYDDYAIYVAAKMYDSQPDSIQREMGFRDSGKNNADIFAIALDTYNKQQNAFLFMVSASGAQTDIYITPNNEDENWNAVWKSAVTIVDDGWIVEMEIPYMALRFPKKEVQTWGLTLHRVIKRTNEESFWNYLDPNVEGVVNQFGTLEGIEGIKPPLRLSLSPYVSGYYNIDEENDISEFTGTAGMDLKWGLNESFTLDMTLIPDFGQVRADNQILNLSAFEIQFDENRSFFTEGTELFDRGNMFYSRRVGKTFGDIDLNDNEETSSAPGEAPLINATKLSGRTSKGLGIGVFNAITDKTFATVKDTLTGETREVLVDPLTNFNALVLEQNLKNNSNIGFMNTNVYRGKDGKMANVSRVDFRFFDKENTYSIKGNLDITHIRDGDNETKTGYNAFLNGGKVSGKYQYVGWLNIESDKYDPNDMGFLRSNNEINLGGRFTYSKQEPFSIFNNMRINTGMERTVLYKPRVFTNMYGWVNFYTQFKNFWELEAWGEGIPVDSYDYFNPRADFEYFYLRRPSYNVGTWFSSDRRKKLAVSGHAWIWSRPSLDQFDNGFNIEPRMRFSNQFSTSFELNYNKIRKEQGFVDHVRDDDDNLQEVIYGVRNRHEFTNSLKANYAFTNKMGLNLRLRHYWGNVRYDSYHKLNKEGTLEDTSFQGFNDDGSSDYNTNFNAFNMELTFSWEFAPSSFLTAVWKNQIYTDDNNVDISFMENLDNTLSSYQLNSFSVKMIYFLDFQQAKRMIKKG
ncbi:DUF5916 domain-containing protein [Limibacter armeniacum]